MKFEGIPLFVSPQHIPEYPQEPGSADLGLVTTKYPVVLAMFGEPWVFVPPTAVILHRGETIRPTMIKEVLQPYYEKPKEYGGDDPDSRVRQALVPPYIEGLWVRVWGELVVEPSAGEGDAWVDPREKVKGDMDQPIIGYAPWTYSIYVSTIDLEITPELEKAPTQIFEGGEESSQDG